MIGQMQCVLLKYLQSLHGVSCPPTSRLRSPLKAIFGAQAKSNIKYQFSLGIPCLQMFTITQITTAVHRDIGCFITST